MEIGVGNPGLLNQTSGITKPSKVESGASSASGNDAKATAEIDIVSITQELSEVIPVENPLNIEEAVRETVRLQQEVQPKIEDDVVILELSRVAKKLSMKLEGSEALAVEPVNRDTATAAFSNTVDVTV